MAVATLVSGQIANVPVTSPSSEQTDLRWIDLFDGKTSAGWVSLRGTQLTNKSWAVVDGCLVPQGSKHEGAVSSEAFRDFELTFEWRAESESSFSFVKYMIDAKPPLPGRSGVVVMIAKAAVPFVILVLWMLWRRPVLTRTSPGKILLFASSSLVLVSWFGTLWELHNLFDELYSSPPALAMLLSGTEARSLDLFSRGALSQFLSQVKYVAVRVGSFNEGRIIVAGNHVEHWLNGVQVLAYDLGSRELDTAVYQRRDDMLWITKKRDGPIALGHGLSNARPIGFRNIKIRRLP